MSVIHDDYDDNHLLMMIMDVVVAEDNVYDNIPKMNVKIVLIKMDAIVHTVVIVVKTFFFLVLFTDNDISMNSFDNSNVFFFKNVRIVWIFENVRIFQNVRKSSTFSRSMSMSMMMIINKEKIYQIQTR